MPQISCNGWSLLCSALLLSSSLNSRCESSHKHACVRTFCLTSASIAGYAAVCNSQDLLISYSRSRKPLVTLVHLESWNFQLASTCILFQFSRVPLSTTMNWAEARCAFIRMKPTADAQRLNDLDDKQRHKQIEKVRKVTETSQKSLKTEAVRRICTRNIEIERPDATQQGLCYKGTWNHEKWSQFQPSESTVTYVTCTLYHNVSVKCLWKCI